MINKCSQTFSSSFFIIRYFEQNVWKTICAKHSRSLISNIHSCLWKEQKNLELDGFISLWIAVFLWAFSINNFKLLWIILVLNLEFWKTAARSDNALLQIVWRRKKASKNHFSLIKWKIFTVHKCMGSTYFIHVPWNISLST